MKPNYVESFDYLRVFSILIIVLGHSLSINFQLNYPFITNILKGSGTYFFVFISGFLFCLLLPKYKCYSTFIKSKSISLLVPYFLFSMPLVIFRFLENDSVFYSLELGLDKNFYPVISLLTGAHMTGYWYIPMIFMLFALSFWLLKYYASLKSQKRYMAIWILSCLAVFAHRPEHNFNPFHSLIYFYPFFLLGMSFYIDRENISKLFGGVYFLAFLFLIFLSLNYMQTYFYLHLGNYHKSLFSYGGIDLNYVKYIIIIPFIYVAFEKLFKKPSQIIKNFANISFWIYFLHPVVISALNIFGIVSFTEELFGSLLNTILIFIFVVFICVFCHRLTNIVLGKNKLKFLGG